MKKFNKATAAAISTAITGVIAATTTLDPTVVAAVGTLITTALVYFVPNIEA